MKSSISKSGFIVILLLAFVSCGSTTRTVQYVYVDGPAYASESAQLHAINNAKAESASPTASPSQGSAVAATNNPAPARVKSSAEQNPRKRLRTLAESAPDGYIRGYGSYISQDEDYAIDMAKAQALKSMAEQAMTRIESSLHQCKPGMNEFAISNGKITLDQIKTRYQISNWRVLDSYVSDGPMFEAVYCVEASAKSIIEYMEPVLNRMNSQERTQIIAIINRGY